MKNNRFKLFAGATLAVTLSVTACGRDSTPSQIKIIGGTPVDATDPLAHRVGSLFDVTGALKCTVVPITPSVFLTAAHCVFNRDLKGWTIQTGLELSGLSAPDETLDVESAVIHENFAPSMLYSLHPTAAPNDIALVKTVQMAGGTIPVPIIRSEIRAALTTPFPLTIAGYGRTIGSDASSKGHLQKASLNITKAAPESSELLAENQDSRMACHGDSGGPAFYVDGDEIYVIGVVSRGDSACAKGTTVFTDVATFSQFITASLTKINQP